MGSTLIRKNLMALTGLFLVLFLVIHLAGNLQLLLPPEKALVQFNLYSRILSGNYIIKVISWLLFLSIALHSIYALMITLQNKKSAGGNYAYDKRNEVSAWYTRNMGLLGSILFIFLIIHLKDYWYQYNFGDLPIDPEGNKDLFTIVIASYSQLWYIGINIAAFIALGYHLLHGFQSAFKTFGAYPSRLAAGIYYLGLLLTAVLTLGFIYIPVHVYLNYHI